MIPAFKAWIESPEPGMEHEHDRVRVVDDVHLGLPDAHRLEEDVVLARGVHQQRGLQRGLREPAERAARGHRADEHARVEEVLGQADAVAEQRALGERRGRIDGQHGHLPVGLARVGCECADQGGLAHAGRTGEPDDGRLAGVRIDLAHELPALGIVVLHQRDRLGERALVAVEQALGELGCGACRERPFGRACYAGAAGDLSTEVVGGRRGRAGKVPPLRRPRSPGRARSYRTANTQTLRTGSSPPARRVLPGEVQVVAGPWL